MPLASWFLRQPPEIGIALLALFILIMVRRLTAGLREDLATGGDIRAILLNHFLYGHGFV